MGGWYPTRFLCVVPYRLTRGLLVPYVTGEVCSVLISGVVYTHLYVVGKVCSVLINSLGSIIRKREHAFMTRLFKKKNQRWRCSREFSLWLSRVLEGLCQDLSPSNFL